MSSPLQTQDALLERHPSGQPFEVRIGGEAVESFWKKSRCGYTEWSFGVMHEGRLESYTKAGQSQTPVLLDDGTGSAEVALATLRLFLQPSFERPLAADQTDLPAELREIVEGGGANYVAEYCLEKGRTYHAMVRQESYALPPTGPDEHADRGVIRLLVISDRPFVDGAPQGEPTPGYRGWSF